MTFGLHSKWANQFTLCTGAIKNLVVEKAYIMETIALGIEYDYYTRKRLARFLVEIEKEFDDSEDRDREPSFGDGLLEKRFDF